ncbi:twin-arginine translocase subunit TatC [Gilvimarinus sp. F26214L]|uniref:twin-arginine translocase subunit TatC n=1 Tax=Gilvimarinus sp. DZF01 TaxID=3461371 RepID=UPI004045F1F6
MTQSAENKQSDDVELPLVAHLKELRDRLLRCLLAVLVVFLCLVYFAPEIYTFVATPMQKVLPEGAQMIAFEVASPFLAPFKLTLYVSFFLAMPFILYQVWGFIAPALYRQEKRVAIPLFVSSVLLFYAGVAFAYFVVFPLIFGFFTSIAPGGIEVAPDINAYLSFVLMISFAFGLAFETPVATVLLIWAGVISPEGLARKRPYVVIVCFVLGMFLTPPDIISQTLLALPMWLLFEVGIFFGRWVKPMEQPAD